MDGFRCLALLTASFPLTLRAQNVTIENAQLRWEIDVQARTVGLVGKATGRDYAAKPPRAIAFVTLRGKRNVEASRARRSGDELLLDFGKGEASARLRVECRAEYIGLEVLEVDALDPQRLTFLQLPVPINEHLGHMMNVAWDDTFGIIGLALTQRTLAAAGRSRNQSVLYAHGYPRSGFEGCKVGLVAAPRPELRLAIHRAAKAASLPAPEFEGGKPIHLTEENRKSYIFTTVGEANVDRVIAAAKAMGFGQIMMLQNCWVKTSGHFEIQDRYYPNGEDGLRDTVAKIRAAGLKAGFHLWASKIHKRDRYATPVPDQRIWRKAQATLDQAIDADDTRIVTVEPPKGFYEKRQDHEVWRDVQIGNEIVTYAKLSMEPPYGLVDCKRGANGTTASAHKAGEIVYQLGVDSCCPGYIIDQDTSLMDEMHDRCAGLLNRVGCDMVYFDGGEDVPTPYWYYVPNFELSVWRRLKPKPIIVQGTIVTHHSWHIFSRNSTVDIVREGSKAHVDKSVLYMLRRREDLLPGELGWYGIWPRSLGGIGTQFDEVDYVCSKCLAYDAPFSIEMNFGALESHVLWPEMIRQVGFYEDLRLRRVFGAEQLEPLKQAQVDFTIFHDGDADERSGWRILAIRPATDLVAMDLRLFLGRIDDTTVAYFWNSLFESEIELALPAAKCELVDDVGEPVHFQRRESTVLVPLEPKRRFLICRGLSEAQVEEAFRDAQAKRQGKATIYVRADSGRFVGRMATCAALGIDEPESVGGAVTFVGRPRLGERLPDDYAEYTIDLPGKGVYAVWARLRYPKGGDMSFALVQADEEYTGHISQALGNSGLAGDVWHWDSRGGGSKCRPGTGLRLIRAKTERVTFRIYPREGHGARDNPRLDLLCITALPDYVPTDEEARTR